MSSNKNPSFNWEKLKENFYRNRCISTTFKWPTITAKANHSNLYAISYTSIAVYLLDSNKIEVYNYKINLLCSIDVSEIVTDDQHNENENKLIKIWLDYSNDDLYIVTQKFIRIVYSWNPIEFKDIIIENDQDQEIWDMKDKFIVTKNHQDIYKIATNPNNRYSIEKIIENDGKFTLLTKDHWDANTEIIILLDITYIFMLKHCLPTVDISKIDSDTAWQKVILSKTSNSVLFYNNKTKNLHIINENGKRVDSDISLTNTPQQLAWCGNDSIACFFKLNSYNEDDNKHELYLYDTLTGTHVSFWYLEEISFIESVSDGVKVFTDKNVYLISKVPWSTKNIFRLGSTSSSAILFDCLNLLEHGSKPRAIENMRSINLEEAIEECIDAAVEELDPILQKKLLLTASFGKGSLINVTSKKVNTISQNYVKTIKFIRFMNNLSSITGILLTNDQFQYVGFPNLILNLVKWNDEFLKCIALCKFLELNGLIADIVYNWSKRKIQIASDEDDDVLYESIVNKIDIGDGTEIYTLKDFQYSRLGIICYNEGRLGLAKKFTILDSNVFEKVKTLLKLEENESALEYAHSSGNPVVELYCLLCLQRKLSQGQFTRILSLKVEKGGILAIYLSDNYEFLFDFYRQIDDYSKLGDLILSKNEARTVIDQVADLKNRSDDPLKKIYNREAELIKYQKELSSKYDMTDIVGCSMNETLKKLLQFSSNKIINSFIKKFSLNDDVINLTKCKIYLDTKRYDPLWTLINSKKNLIGNENIIMTIYKKLYYLHDAKTEAVKYIKFIATNSYNYEKKLKMYLECGDYLSAAQLATYEKDSVKLQSIYDTCSDESVKLQIKNFFKKI
ncbi:uncharacterized protein SCODWIG_00356 [Saccharomycodes ludwigii]|uniref:Probable vacuolar protein sorting-associated protein 16 homolog n=1 Tax=Saccharomycodes ludwigii TaxID=36035 RepID=A0A376B1N7_9ASCO|nr:uncharacterized protein SCODWIG_00356 [Saccharomycodes ludwigii]